MRKKWATIAIKILGSLNDDDIETVDSCVQKLIDFRQVAIEIWIQKNGFIPILGDIFLAGWESISKLSTVLRLKTLKLYGEIDFRQVGVIRTAADHLGS